MKLRPWLLVGLLALPAASWAAPPKDRAMEEAVAALRQRVQGELRATWTPAHAAPTSLRGFQSRPHAGGPEAAAREFLREHMDLLRIDPKGVRTLLVEGSGERTAVRLEQTYEGLRVVGSTLVVTVDGAGRVTSLSGALAPIEVAAASRTIDEGTALGLARAALSLSDDVLSGAELIVMASAGVGRVAWQVTFALEPLKSHPRVVLDAETGEVLWVHETVVHD